jgi:hypothetical protein
MRLIWLKTGVVGVVIWAAWLAVAFTHYPCLDNLIVTMPWFVMGGVDGVATVSHNVTLFAVTLIVETVGFFGFFAGVGLIMRMAVLRQQRSS